MFVTRSSRETAVSTAPWMRNFRLVIAPPVAMEWKIEYTSLRF